jgi:hypothetical protein
MDEHLVGYLLNALDPVTHHRVEAYLRTHPDAQDRLARLERGLAPLTEERTFPDPPADLVFATLARVAEHQARSLPAAPAPSPHQVGTPGRRWLRSIDGLVAALVLVLAGGLLLSFVAKQWQDQRRLACANNLRQFWVALGQYADLHDHSFPKVEARGSRSVAAIYVPVLHDQGFLAGVKVQCPAQDQEPPPAVTLAELDRLYRENPARYRSVARELGGNYAYSLGYREGERLYGLTRFCDEQTPILADCPTPGGQGNSLNHGRPGQNVLYVGGVVRWCGQPTVGPAGDDIYLNQAYQVRAGLNRSDAVLGPGDASPDQPE